MARTQMAPKNIFWLSDWSCFFCLRKPVHIETGSEGLIIIQKSLEGAVFQGSGESQAIEALLCIDMQDPRMCICLSPRFF